MMNINNPLLVTLMRTAMKMMIIMILNTDLCLADVDSGCPSWGCLPWGSFSLSAGIPAQNCTTPWRVELETVSSSSDQIRVPRGCVSDQQSVVCTTQTGYVSVDPTNGKRLWSYSTKAPPYLPFMDIYGDVIGMDEKALYYVESDGKPKNPITLGEFKPQHSLMISNNSIMLITGSTNKTAQILTYDTDGIVDGALELKDSIENINGSFIPCSQPIIAGFRVYVMTYFSPDDPDSDKSRGTSGMLRLYAIDVLQKLMPRIVVAWYYNLGSHSDFLIENKTKNIKLNPKLYPNNFQPIVTYFNGTAYVNVPGNWEKPSGKEGGREGRVESNADRSEPYHGLLWAIEDNGSSGKLRFRTNSLYGPMAVFDTYDNPLLKSQRSKKREKSVFVREIEKFKPAKKSEISEPNENKDIMSEPVQKREKSKLAQKREQGENPDHLLWIVNRSPAMIQGYNVHNGTIKPISGFDAIFDKIGREITSKLSMTRSSPTTTNDQLVLGTTDSLGQAVISVIEVYDNNSKATLVLSRIVSKPGLLVNTDTRAEVEGQIVNFAFYPPEERQGDRGKGVEEEGEKRMKIKERILRKDSLTLGLAAVVTETNSTSVTRSVVGIF